MKGLLGRKVGMTQMFLEDGRRLPVTVINVASNIIIQKKSQQGRDGYTAIKLGFEDAHKFEKEGTETEYRLNRPRLGVFLKAGVAPKKHVRELRLDREAELDEYTVGQEISTEIFSIGEIVDVAGTSKGCGFSGVMKRHNFGGTRATHGTHEAFRHGGSIGASADPAKVFKGMKMPGQLGDARVTVQNLQVVDILADENLLVIKGSVPGPSGSLVMVKAARKRNGVKAI